jgi:hypothetical protein
LTGIYFVRRGSDPNVLADLLECFESTPHRSRPPRRISFVNAENLVASPRGKSGHHLNNGDFCDGCPVTLLGSSVERCSSRLIELSTSW